MSIRPAEDRKSDSRRQRGVSVCSGPSRLFSKLRARTKARKQKRFVQRIHTLRYKGMHGTLARPDLLGPSLSASAFLVARKASMHSKVGSLRSPSSLHAVSLASSLTGLQLQRPLV